MSDVRRTDEEIMQKVSLSLKQIDYEIVGVPFENIKWD